MTTTEMRMILCNHSNRAPCRIDQVPALCTTTTTHFLPLTLCTLCSPGSFIKSHSSNHFITTAFHKYTHCPSEETHKHRSQLIAPSSSHYGGRHSKLDKNLVTTKPDHNRNVVVDRSIAGKRHAHCRNSLDSDRAPVSAAVA